MLKRLVVALVGMAMGGLVGLVGALLGYGNSAILMGAVIGGVAFSVGSPRAGKAG